LDSQFTEVALHAQSNPGVELGVGVGVFVGVILGVGVGDVGGTGDVSGSLLTATTIPHTGIFFSPRGFNASWKSKGFFFREIPAAGL
jgi:hypothetical protein